MSTASCEQLLDWLRDRSPNLTWDAAHLTLLARRLAELPENGRLMVNMPPRHGKTQLVTIHYPVWRLERERTTRIILAAYNQRLASYFSRRARRLWRDPASLNALCRGAEEWETTDGGGVRAVGVGGGVTGHGANLVVIDDPVKSREEADSAALRDRVWDWYRDDLYTRLEPRGQLVLVMTRWHEDDLAGRILTSEEGLAWDVLRLPALSETQAERDRWERGVGRSEGLPDPLGREPGTPLWPRRFPDSALDRIRRALGTRGFEALYQQRPAPLEGMFFRREWLQFVDAVPAQAEWCRAWDKAASAGEGDWTAGVLVGRACDGRFYVADVVRGRWLPGERERVIRSTAELDLAYGHVTILLEQEPGSGGKDSARASMRNLAGFAVTALPVTGKKETRADTLAAQMEIGEVFLVRGPWNAAFVDELLAFPHGRHDDQVDAAAAAFHRLANRGYVAWGCEAHLRERLTTERRER